MDVCDSVLIEKLYCSYMSYLIIQSKKYLCNSCMCEDVLQDCAAEIAEKIAIIKMLNERELKAFLSASVKSSAAKYNREFSRISNGIKESGTYNYFEDDEEYAIRFDKVISAINELSARDRDIIIMKYKYLMSDSEIAEILGIKKDSVRMTVRRSIFRLRKKLGVIKRHEAI